MSDAVGTELISKILGYKIAKGTPAASTTNLPQRIAILAEANEANQSALDTTPKEITSAKQAGDLYGYGSPIYHIMRILRPFSGIGVGGIPTVVYPQAKAASAAARVMTITPSGTATANGTHTLVIAGRKGLEGVFYDINVVKGDVVADITQKIEDAINAVLGCPVSATSSETVATATAKWNGLTSNSISITVDTNGKDLGLSYVVAQDTAGSGTPSIAAALTAFGSEWNTIVINSYGTETNTLTALEAYNGIPDTDSPTGRYAGIIMKPFIALTGSTADDPSSVTDAREEEVTISICPAPGSDGLPMEAAANYAALWAPQAQNNPHLDISGQYLPDMPVPADGDIGSMASYVSRDAIVKKGCSTTELAAGRYRVVDFVTTYHPEGEVPPQFRYCRNLVIDFNVKYGYYQLAELFMVDHILANNNDIVEASKVWKPKIWKQILTQYATDLVKRGILVDAAFTEASIATGIASGNPDRVNTTFSYKRSGYARIASTTGTAFFNFGL